LFIDGLGWCDQYTAHRLARDGLIRPAIEGASGSGCAQNSPSSDERFSLESLGFDLAR
jgi:hypothetical protein